MIDDIERYRLRAKVRQETLRRLGVSSTLCALCGEDDPVCFEEDHIAGRAYSGETSTLCVNCHRKRTVRQRTEHPPVGVDPTNKLEIAARTLLGRADYYELAAERDRRLAAGLLDLRDRGIKDATD